MKYSDDEHINKLLENIIAEIKQYTEGQVSNIKNLSEIGIALSAEKNLIRLLEEIISQARIFSNADAGTLYIMNDEKGCLEFAIVQNDTMKIRMGGTAGAITWPPVPIVKDGQPNLSNVSSYAAITGTLVNIPDVYETEEFDFSGTRKFDATTGYRSKSMLVIPMKNRENETIGVLQLINALDPATRVPTAFSADCVDLIVSLASQAAVAVTNVKLYRDLENLFDSFIKTIASAIDEKSHYTAGHIQRVQRLTMDIARRMNEQTDGNFKNFLLSEDKTKELSIAAWLHDIGKIVTPEYVVDKSTKLEKIFDVANLIAVRYEVIKRDARIRSLEKKLKAYESGETSARIVEGIDKSFEEEFNLLKEERDFIMDCNNSGEFMDEGKIDRLKKISEKKWDFDGREESYLSADELKNLSIRKGSLTDEERKIIENHAMVTFKMLSNLPFPKKLQKVIEYASAHHEKLDGTGYPFGLKAEQISYPARIIAIADIFEALTARDRPYRKPMKISQALKILDLMRKDGHIDAGILDLFIKEKIYEDYARQELNADQIDC